MARKPTKRGGPAEQNKVPQNNSREASGSNDGDALWDHLVQTVQPIARTDKRAPIDLDMGRKSKSGVRPKLPNQKSEERPRLVVGDITIGGSDQRGAAAQYHRVSSTNLGHGDSPGVDKRTATRFRRGQMPIDATLDLHGQTREGARPLLTSFLVGEQSAGSRCVIVVTGKGMKEDWSPGVLKEAVPIWLNSGPLNQIVLSFSFAQPRHGGSGALYVLLKRIKNTE